MLGEAALAPVAARRILDASEERNMDFRRIVREGFVGGLIGAAAVAAWFLIVDSIAGRPLFTPAMLGGAVFWGVDDPANVSIAVPAVAGYTMLHVIAFVAVGMIAAGLAQAVESFPPALFLIVVGLAAFEFAFYLIVALFARPLLGALAWWNVAAGNAIAIVGIGSYLWRAHPKMREVLKAHPLGEAITQITLERIKKSQAPRDQAPKR